VITPTKLDNKLGSTGMGRVIRFSQSVPLHDLIENIGQRTGEPASIAVATPQGSEYSALVINKVAVCAGSGGGVFRGLKEKVDLLVTGEMSHHEVLAAIEQGTCVVCLGHSDSERLYLREVMVAKLKQALKEVGWGGGGDETWEVMVSNRDRDPFGRAVRVK
jgi:putative NIF3 family GTP cyclohydrolase 1 type 2